MSSSILGQLYCCLRIRGLSNYDVLVSVRVTCCQTQRNVDNVRKEVPRKLHESRQTLENVHGRR